MMGITSIRMWKWNLRLCILCGMVLATCPSFARADPLPIASTSGSSSSQPTCPENLETLKPEIENALRYVTSSSFREALLASLEISIPEAIEQADGLSTQIAFLKQEIIRQEGERRHAETVAREELEDPSQPLKPCRRREESSYCYAMEQYYVASAANLANHAFLDALQCYQRNGMR